MKYYKTIENGIVMIHSCNELPAFVTREDEISYEKYEELRAMFINAPMNTFEFVYYFDWKTQTYLPRERTHDEIIDWFVEVVSIGTVALEDISAEYRAEVEARLPVSEEEQWVREVMSEVSDYGY